MGPTPRTVSAATPWRTDFARAQHLVSAQWLSALVAGHAVEHAPAPGWCLMELACDGFATFVNGHIPGAHYLDTRQLERLPWWNAAPDAVLQRVLRSAGIGPGTTVILYARNMLAAARAAHLMLYAGVRDVRLLDGGLAAWCAAGLALQSGPALARPQAEPDWHAAFPARPDYLLGLAQARNWSRQPGHALVSIRTHAEYMGETSGYDYIARRGEIPGAIWGRAGADGDVNNMQHFQSADGLLRSASAIADMWAEAGIHPHMHLAFYCGTGWRASLAFLVAWLMGWERISLFDGGWMEWSADSSLPVVCRTP